MILSKLKSESGQGMSEYMILVLLIAVGSIAGVTTFGKTLSSKMHAIHEKVQHTSFTDTEYTDH